MLGPHDRSVQPATCSQTLWKRKKDVLQLMVYPFLSVWYTCMLQLLNVRYKCVTLKYECIMDQICHESSRSPRFKVCTEVNIENVASWDTTQLCRLIDKYQHFLKHFIVPTDAHCYKNHRMLKQFKIITLAPTCFGSRRNHHQGAVLCLAKTTEYGFSVHSGGSSCLHCEPHACTTGWYAAITLTASIPTSTEKPYSVVLAKHRTAPWWWFLREPKHVGASVVILNCFNILWFL